MKTTTFSIEVIPVPVSDVERALRFYVDEVGFTLDLDYSLNDAFRVLLLTPRGSNCSIHIGEGFADAPARDCFATFISSSQISMPLGIACSNAELRSERFATRPLLECGTEVSLPARIRPRGLCQLRYLFRSGWQHLGLTRAELPRASVIASVPAARTCQ